MTSGGFRGLGLYPLATSRNTKDSMYWYKMHWNIQCINPCHFHTSQNIMTYTFRGCAHHTPCIMCYAFYYPFQRIHQINCHLNLDFDSSKIKQPIAIASAMECCMCMRDILVLYNVKQPDTFMKDCTHHTYCFISICIFCITTFKSSLCKCTLNLRFW